MDYFWFLFMWYMVVRIGGMNVVMVVVVDGFYIFFIYCVVYFMVVNIKFFGVSFFYFGIEVVLEDDVVDKID